MLNDLGVLDRNQNRKEEAQRAYEEALKIYRELAQSQKDSESYLSSLARVLHNLGMLDSDQNRPQEALQAFSTPIQCATYPRKLRPEKELHARVNRTSTIPNPILPDEYRRRSAARLRLPGRTCAGITPRTSTDSRSGSDSHGFENVLPARP